MRQPDLTDTQRMAVARISGSADRLSIGRDKDLPRDEKIAELHAISTDPVVFGSVLGDFLWQVETESRGWQVAVDLLRAAGADEDTAAAKLAWLRQRDVGYEGGFRL